MVFLSLCLVSISFTANDILQRSMLLKIQTSHPRTFTCNIFCLLVPCTIMQFKQFWGTPSTSRHCLSKNLYVSKLFERNLCRVVYIDLQPYDECQPHCNRPNLQVRAYRHGVYGVISLIQVVRFWATS